MRIEINNAKKYFKKLMKNKKFVKSYNKISKQVNIKWEVEKIKNKGKKDARKLVDF